MSRVYGHVRLLAGIVLLAATTGTATADGYSGPPLDGEPRVQPVPRFSTGLFLMIHSGAINGVAAAGLGPNVELAVGMGSTQYFVEGTYGWATLGPRMEPRTGAFVRGAAGIRWIARSFDIDRSAAVEMTLEAVAGAHQYRIDGDTLSRPELGAGVALQLRKYRGPRISARFSLRAFWAPVDEDTEVITRGGVVPATAPATNGGLMATIGAAR